MASKTINRRPFTVNTPTSSDVKEHFFNHSNWKGLSNEENFAVVDQETFHDCDNVYMDEQGLLRSRPCCKIHTITANGSTLSNILDFWHFDDVDVYKSKNINSYYLTFVESNGAVFQVECEEQVKLILVEEKIFLFSPLSFNVYDIKEQDENLKYRSAEEFIYVPTKHSITNDVVIEKLDSENELTTSYYTTYIYTNVASLRLNKFSGQTLNIRIDGDEYNVNMTKNTDLILVSKYSTLDNTNYVIPPGLGTISTPLFSVSEIGNGIIYSNVNDYWEILYTSDGLTFLQLPTLKESIGYPSITKDGHHVILFKKDGPYAISVVDDAIFTWSSWTNVLNTIYPAEYTLWLSSGFSIESASDDSVQFNYDFVTVNKFAFVYGVKVADVHLNTQFKEYYALELVVSDGDVLYKNIVSDSSGSFVESFIKPNGLLGPVELTKWTYDDFDTILDLSDGRKAKYMARDWIIKAISDNTMEFSGTWYINVEGLEYEYSYTSTSTKDANNKYTWSLRGQGDLTFYDGELTVRFRNYDLYQLLGTYYGYLPSVKYIDVEELIVVNSVLLNDGKYVIEHRLLNADATTNVAARKNSLENLYSPMYWDSHISDSEALSTWKELTVCYCSKFSGTSDDVITLTKYVSQKEFNRLSESASINLIRTLDNPVSKISKDGKYVLTSSYLYDSEYKEFTDLLFSSYPLAIHEDIWLISNNVLYKSNNFDSVEIDVLTKGDTHNIFPESYSELSNWYFSNGNKLYISAYPSDGKFKWYFPRINTEVIDYYITNLHPISSTEMAIFTDSQVYISTATEAGYTYTKSKLDIGCKLGSDVIFSRDAQYTILPTEDGIVALTYQQFVASSERVLLYLTDSIKNKYRNFSQEPIKLLRHGFWIICYRRGYNSVLVFDIRNNSWWPMHVNENVTSLHSVNGTIFIIGENNFYKLTKNTDEYYDYDGSASKPIVWFVESQKLHLNALNYYKHVSNITLTSVLDEDSTMDLDLTVTNYRKKSNTSETENFEFDVDAVRVFVKRLNYSKVNEFSYKLDCSDSAIQVPLSLSSISIKYKISGQVR